MTNTYKCKDILNQNSETQSTTTAQITPPRSGTLTAHQCAVIETFILALVLIIHQILLLLSRSPLIISTIKTPNPHPMLRRPSHLLHHHDLRQRSRIQKEITFPEPIATVISHANPTLSNSHLATLRRNFQGTSLYYHLSQLSHPQHRSVATVPLQPDTIGQAR